MGQGGPGNRVAAGSFRLPTNPCLRDTTELIVVAHKGSPSLPTPGQALVEENGRRVSPWLDPATFLDLAQDRWRVPAEPPARVGHPAAFPVALVERLIKLYAFRGSRVLDPFAGSGTVGVASQRLGCRATLVEVDPTCCKLAEKRLRRAACAAGESERRMAGAVSRGDASDPFCYLLYNNVDGSVTTPAWRSRITAYLEATQRPNCLPGHRLSGDAAPYPVPPLDAHCPLR